MRPARAADAFYHPPGGAVGRQVARLAGLGVIAPVSRAAESERESPRRFLLATPGLRRLAARDRVPLATHGAW
ncbi:MAG: hypothetical protein F4020_08560 [Gammaproteobacteria bacterium]|nr:hypothetical protein [Gammaproteobacteria bacterium]